QFVYVPIVTREAHAGALGNRVTTLMQDSTLEKHTGMWINAENSHVMMCGSSEMITDVSEELVSRGMQKHRRRTPGHYTTEKYH
ncbi:MAG TPA: ferredoxin--NADP(+) reductase, partial [Gammaproteobacteria bacterium]|nr:ferredoxin--NADP(+) reductase [Gammaproteobacteria bacterium]